MKQLCGYNDDFYETNYNENLYYDIDYDQICNVNPESNTLNHKKEVLN